MKFGNSLSDYIIYQPNMEPLQNGNAFSVCSWVKSLRSSGIPCWLNYAVSNSVNEILISDNGAYNFIFDKGWNLESYFTMPSGAWYHYCYSWSLSAGTQIVYLNGQQIGSRSISSGRNVRTGGYLIIGNDQNGSPAAGMSTTYIFGGELYKLNFFSKELSGSEVQDMAKDMCSDTEESFGDLRTIKWEDILQKQRNGDIKEIVLTECEVIHKSGMLNFISLFSEYMLSFFFWTMKDFHVILL